MLRRLEVLAATCLVLVFTALALPPAFGGEELRPGVGWETREGAVITYARGLCADQNWRVRTEFDPWTAVGDPDAQTFPISDPVFKRLYCLRYDRHDDCQCINGGTKGSAHGVSVENRLRQAFAEGKLGDPETWTGQPNLREELDVAKSGDEWCRLTGMLGIDCAGGVGTCGGGWRCTGLIKLPPEERPPLSEVELYSFPGTPSEACSWNNGRGKTYVLSRQECFEGLPADCQAVGSLREECWSPGPPDPPTDPPPCPTCPEPELVQARIEPDGCGPYSGRIVTGGDVLPFTPGVRSTGRIELELRPRPPCPPEPPPEPCPEPGPCEPPPVPDPDPPPPSEPGWEVLWQAPAGWSWSAGGEVPAEVFELRVPAGGSYRGLRVSYEVAVDWSRCRELPGPGPSAKCLGMYITERGQADRVFSYLMAERRQLTHRHGFVPGWRPHQKPKASAPPRLLDGATYRIEHEIRDGSVTVSVLRDGEGASILRPPNTCSPSPCFPASFSGPVVLKAGWRGDEVEEVGGTMGWRLSGLRVEVRRGE